MNNIMTEALVSAGYHPHSKKVNKKRQDRLQEKFLNRNICPVCGRHMHIVPDTNIMVCDCEIVKRPDTEKEKRIPVKKLLGKPAMISYARAFGD